VKIGAEIWVNGAVEIVFFTHDHRSMAQLLTAALPGFGYPTTAVLALWMQSPDTGDTMAMLAAVPFIKNEDIVTAMEKVGYDMKANLATDTVVG
jgi:hypothetical protein